VGAAEELAERDFEAATCEIFRHDIRIQKLRQAVRTTPDLEAAAFEIFGKRDLRSIERLIGLVRIASLARYTGSDARLVPCRYHFFVRGLSGGFVAFDHIDDKGCAAPSLFLEQTRTTSEDSKRLN